ncbi:MAG TPA: HEAT repeat domain-containing protein [Vicinamibacterales bacterium]|nr:HEAT repeat domain-containing protein [Vicinamibacterales bacterium]
MTATFQRVTIAGVLVVAAVAAPAARQAAQASQETLLLAQGWAYLSGGDANNAASVAGQLLAQYPLSSAGVSLAVEAELPRTGWLGALGVYEQWLGARRMDEPYALRRVARACLRQALGDLTTRPSALQALIADGDQDALAEATRESARGKFGDTEALAAVGDDRAVRALVDQLESIPDARGPIIEALARSRNKLAVPPLIKLLDATNDVTRAQAADALGQLGATEVIGKLRPLLDEKQPYYVRFSAARALGRLGDASGVLFLRQAMDTAAGAPGASLLRIQAAAALAAIGPDTGWIDTARALLSDPEPFVRAEAAQCLAPYDNAAAKATLDAMMNDPNPAIRQKAGQILAKNVAGDVATLRRLLRSADAEARIVAAGRILEITR